MRLLLPTSRKASRRVPLAAALFLWALSVPLLGQEASSAPGEPRIVTLHPGDAVEIDIWRELDLSGRFIVDQEGAVTLPLVGRVAVAGISLEQLTEMLLERYRVELRNPSIEITPLRRVYVMGEVNFPGLFSLDPTVTLAGAVALAGGANPQGNIEKLQIMRDGRLLDVAAGPEMDLLSVDIRSGDQIFVERRSWLDRNSAVVVSATITSVASILVALVLR